MRSLIEFKYDNQSDGAKLLVSAGIIRDTFIGCQKHFYQ